MRKVLPCHELVSIFYMEIHIYYLCMSSCNGKDTPLTNCAINSLRPNDKYMRRWTGSTLFKVMSSRLFGIKHLPEPKPPSCSLDVFSPAPVKFESQHANLRERNAFESIVSQIPTILFSHRYVCKCILFFFGLWYIAKIIEFNQNSKSFETDIGAKRRHFRWK